MRTDASNLSLPGLFANTCFRIPNYQRGYAWRESQLNDLWDDIMDIQKNGAVYRPHYTGAITLQQININALNPSEKKLAMSGTEFFNVVDGQQRLTTIVLLMNALAKIYKKNHLVTDYIKTGKVCKFAYVDTGGNSYRYFMKEIICDPNVLPYSHTVYTANLHFASKFFENKLTQLSKKRGGLHDIYQKLLTSLVFDTKYIQNNLDVQAVFETMNNRGKPLTTLEKLKNRLLYMTSKFNSTNVNITQISNNINSAWGLIYETLGQNISSLLSEDEFLSAYLTLLREPADYSFSESLAETKVFQMFCNRATKYDLSMSRNQSQLNKAMEPPVDEKKIGDFVVGIANYVKPWYDVSFPDLNTQNGLNIQKIQYLNGSKEMRIFLAQLLMMEHCNPVLVAECLDMTVQVLFRNSLPGVSLLDERRFATRARELYNNSLTLVELECELEDLLTKPIDVQSLIGGFRYLFTYVRGHVGFYRWSALKFFLMEYEKYLQGSGFHHVEWKNYPDVQIEHIMPQKWSNHWQTEMNAYLNAHSPLTPDEDVRAKNIIVNSLGNLTVIQDINNPIAGNKPWITKKQVYTTASYSEAEIVNTASWNPWGYASIKARGERMLDFLCKYLQYKNYCPLTLTQNASQNDYADILFYDSKYS